MRQIGSYEIRAQGLLQLINYSQVLHTHARMQFGDPSLEALINYSP